MENPDEDTIQMTSPTKDQARYAFNHSKTERQTRHLSDGFTYIYAIFKYIHTYIRIYCNIIKDVMALSIYVKHCLSGSVQIIISIRYMNLKQGKSNVCILGFAWRLDNPRLFFCIIEQQHYMYLYILYTRTHKGPFQFILHKRSIF